MLKPVSTTVGACAIGLATMGSAVSPEAMHVFETASKVVESTETSMSLFGAKNALISQLLALANECSNDGWDGGDAVALLSEAIHNAKSFIRALPEDFPLPEVAPEPDGAVSLDWIRSKHRLFSLSIGRSSRLAYAWLDGASRGYGVFSYNGQLIPARERACITEIMTDANITFRVA